MKKQRKYLFVAVLFSLLIACEKDADNTVPGNPKERIEDHRQDFNRVFTSNNTENGKIWISDAQYYPNLYNYASRKDGQSLPFFVALNPKQNNNINIYLTVRHKQLQSDSPKDEFGLLSNPNKYSIKGTFKLSFSISRQSVLSSLREKEIFDFDFDVYRYNQDSIHLKAIYQIRNKDIIFRSYDFNDNVKAFLGACQNLFDIGNHNLPGGYNIIFSSWFNYSVKFEYKDSKDSILSYNPSLSHVSNINMFVFSNMIEPYYNKEEKVFAFKIREEFQMYSIQLSDNLNLFSKYNTKYLIPVSATDNKMVFSAVGKKLDDQGKVTNEDETYTITIEKL